MSPDTIPWIIAIASAALLAAAATLWALRQRKTEPPPLPEEWTLTARPVFSSDERRVYRQLREALPHHIVLSKLPLVRFCQPTDPQQVRYWYELLGSIHVGFAICSANGRVLAAIDIDTERGNSRRALQIKQKVLAACRVRYLRCPVDHLPSVPELQLLVPQQMPAARAPLAASPAPAPAPGGRRRQHRALWQDSGFFQDSFFGTDSRMSGDGGAPSELGGFMRGLSTLPPAAAGDDEPGIDGKRAAPVRH
ncbi:DUF2726 domain-containing protein [Rubrivivax albus]|uniref:DUF2726 domain-containing protein n=1 Tax=Rubrivivax albus TaxID=2499835 RepID=A0A3S2TNP5_9BURK|nr:DUF2726 domain-containing protein [Rubrivivax albus]RVT53349.1 DUF2726 domain-containing protein [Rubrivivax albus]